jgi:hypothetical protein
MRDDWFYTVGDKPIGPFVSVDELVPLLRKEAKPLDAKVWNTGYKDWRLVRDVPEIAALLRVSKNKRRLIAFFVVLVVVLVVGAVFSTFIYGNSAGGMGSLFGELIGTAALLSLPGFLARRKTYTPAIVLAVAALVVGLRNAPKLVEGIEFQRGLNALKDTHGFNQALAKNPSNTFLQLVAGARKIGEETERESERLSDNIEPPALNKEINFATATREDLASYRKNLDAAEKNAKQASLHYTVLLKKERDDMASLARSLNISDSVTQDFLKGIDKRQASALAFTTKMVAARAEFYRVLGDYVTVLIEQSGKYKVEPRGQFIFANQLAADRFNAASSGVNSATKKVNELDAERQQMVQVQQQEWERFQLMGMH